MDLLTLTDLAVRTRIGVPDQERTEPQRLFVSVKLAVDAAKIAKEDAVDATADYAKIYDDIQMLAATERRTIERFAEDIAALLLQTYTAHVTVTVKKSPHDLPLLGEASICITRSKF